MENHEAKEVNKPGCIFTLLLFFFFYLLVIDVLQIFRFYSWNGINPLNEDYSLRSVMLSLSGLILAFCFAFTAIYKTLQSKYYSIVMLKYAVFFFLCKSLLEFIKIDANCNEMQFYIQLAKILFFLISIIYLIKSKSVEVYLPSVKRKSKLVHLLAMSIFLICVVPTFYQRGRMAYVSKHIPTEDIMLKPDELTDGLSVFLPLESWTLDSVYNDSNKLIHEFEGNRSTKYYVASINERFRSRIHFSALQSQFQFSPVTKKVGKILKKDTIINGNKLLYDIYRLEDSEEESIYWTFAGLYAKDSYKAIVVSSYESGSFEQSEKSMLKFLESVDFDLRERASKK